MTDEEWQHLYENFETTQKVFHGKELLPKVIEALNKEKGVSITRGNLD